MYHTGVKLEAVQFAEGLHPWCRRGGEALRASSIPAEGHPRVLESKWHVQSVMPITCDLVGHCLRGIGLSRWGLSCRYPTPWWVWVGDAGRRVGESVHCRWPVVVLGRSGHGGCGLGMRARCWPTGRGVVALPMVVVLGRLGHHGGGCGLAMRAWCWHGRRVGKSVHCGRWWCWGGGKTHMMGVGWRSMRAQCWPMGRGVGALLVMVVLRRWGHGGCM